MVLIVATVDKKEVAAKVVSDSVSGVAIMREKLKHYGSALKIKTEVLE